MTFGRLKPLKVSKVLEILQVFELRFANFRFAE